MHPIPAAGGLLALLASACVCGVAGSKLAGQIMMSQTLQSTPSSIDVFAKLSVAQRNAWDYSDGRTINQTADAFGHTPVDLLLNVKFVGFDGDGNGGLHLSEAQALRYLRALKLDLGSFVMEPEPRLLAVQPRLHFQATKAHPSVMQRIREAVAANVHTFQQERARAAEAAAVTNEYVPHPHGCLIPHTAVENVIAAEELGQAYFTLFVINTPRQNVDFVYSFDAQQQADDKAYQMCPGSAWASRTKPYAWIDLTAGPLAYGPMRGGQGQVYPHTVPQVEAFQGQPGNAAMLSELAALAGSAVQHLAWPPVQHSSLWHTEELEVRVLHIHDTLGVPPKSVDLNILKSALAASLQGAVRLDVKEAFISFAQCDVCVAAYSSALRVRTHRLMGAAIAATSGQLLDRLALHTALKEYGEVMLAYAGVHVPDSHTPDVLRLLPIFVFDLASKEEALLLDGELQAAAFPDMVVAVATRAPPVNAGHACNQQPVHLQPGNATRAVLAAILQTAFGMSHTAARYHPASGAGWNHLWALGATPFGPMSGMAHLSHSLSAVPLRNLALLELDRHIDRLVRALQGFAQLSPKGRWEAALPGKTTRKKMTARLNLATFKIELAAKALAERRNADALKLAQSLAHEANAVERIASTVEATITRKLVCAGHTDWTQLVWAPAGSAVAVLLAVWWRSRGARLKADSRYDRMY